MSASSRTDFAILITFITGIISIVYFIAITLLVGSDPTLAGIPESYLSWMVIERLVFTGIIIVMLSLITYILFRQKAIERMQTERPAYKARKLRSEKEIKKDIMRCYRDLGALKIVLKDGALDPETYNERKKYLEEMVRIKKKELENFKK